VPDLLECLLARDAGPKLEADDGCDHALETARAAVLDQGRYGRIDITARMGRAG
jgi:hypothetical protein